MRVRFQNQWRKLSALHRLQPFVPLRWMWPNRVHQQPRQMRDSKLKLWERWFGDRFVSLVCFRQCSCPWKVLSERSKSSERSLRCSEYTFKRTNFSLRNRLQRSRMEILRHIWRRRLLLVHSRALLQQCQYLRMISIFIIINFFSLCMEVRIILTDKSNS